MATDFLSRNHQICSSGSQALNKRGDSSPHEIHVRSAFVNGSLGTGCFSGVQGRLSKYFGRRLSRELVAPFRLRKSPELKAAGGCTSVAEEVLYICLVFPLPSMPACGLWWKQDIGLNGSLFWGHTPLSLFTENHAVTDTRTPGAT